MVIRGVQRRRWSLISRSIWFCWFSSRRYWGDGRVRCSSLNELGEVFIMVGMIVEVVCGRDKRKIAFAEVDIALVLCQWFQIIKVLQMIHYCLGGDPRHGMALLYV